MVREEGTSRRPTLPWAPIRATFMVLLGSSGEVLLSPRCTEEARAACWARCDVLGQRRSPGVRPGCTPGYRESSSPRRPSSTTEPPHPMTNAPSPSGTPGRASSSRLPDDGTHPPGPSPGRRAALARTAHPAPDDDGPRLGDRGGLFLGSGVGIATAARLSSSPMPSRGCS
ncbi:hypothetical protein NKG05_10690 [Oerskovia sp. M15]